MVGFSASGGGRNSVEHSHRVKAALDVCKGWVGPSILSREFYQLITRVLFIYQVVKWLFM